jgi:geranylgeranyl pyrophosphate synthase
VQADLGLVERELESVSRVDFPLLGDLLRHVLTPTGKRLRPALALLSARLGDFGAAGVIPTAAAIEVLHTATLVHDDLVDNASVRRGTPTLNSVWSMGPTVLVGDYLFAQSAEMVSRTGNTRVIRRFSETLMVICDGVLRELFSARDSQLTREDYFRRIGSKTAALFAAATESGAVLAGLPEPAIDALYTYGHNLGMAFQIVDDILDCIGDERELGKPVGSDLLQGTLTLPSMIAIDEHPNENPVRAMFSSTDGRRDLAAALALIRVSSAVPASYNVAAAYAETARSALADLPHGPALASLDALAEYVVRRRR